MPTRSTAKVHNTTETHDTIRPAIAHPPGDHLRDALKGAGLSQREFAVIIDRPYQAVNEIIRGKKSITPATSRDISVVFGTSPDFWYRLQLHYDEWMASAEPTSKDRKRAREIAKRAASALQNHGARRTLPIEKPSR